MDLSHVVKSKALGAVPFEIERTSYIHQGPQVAIDSSEQIAASGVIYPGNAQMIDQLPEEHKHDDFIVVFSDTKLSLGVKDGGRFTAPDRIRWNGEIWRVVRIRNWSMFGYHQGVAVRVRD